MENLSIKELKKIILDAKLEIPSGIEKSELILLAKKASLLPKVKHCKYPNKYKEIGCKIETCKVIYIFFHGYGADENQFDSLFSLIKNQDQVTFICPKSIKEGWWDLDIGEWMLAMQNPLNLELKMKETPKGLLEARNLNLLLLEELKFRRNYQEFDLFLGGFSQGGAMALDLALTLQNNQEKPIYLGLFSTLPINIEYWKTQVMKAKLKVLITHGKSDFVIPYQASQVILSILRLNTLTVQVQFQDHSNGHVLGDETILKLCQHFLNNI